MKSICILWVGVSLLLTACGGVGSDPAASTNATSYPIDRYIGTWSKKCDTWSVQDITDLNGRGVDVKETFKLDKMTASKASYVYTLKVYAHSDTGCVGEPIATLVKTGDNNQSQTLSGATLTTSYGPNELSYTGTQALQAITVDKLQITQSKLVNARITVGGAIVKLGSALSDGYSGDYLAQFKSSSQLLLNSIVNNNVPAVMEDDDYLVWTKSSTP